MTKLKERILQSAWELFREKGYEDVSLRAIAEHAGTTIGNLTYHYPQKEDLVMAMQLTAQGEILTQYGELPGTPEGVLRELWNMAKITEEVGEERSFYFCSLFRLCRDMPALRVNVEKTRERVRGIYLRRFKALQEAGFMRKDLPDGVYVSLASLILLSCSSWMFARRHFEDKVSQISICQAMRDLFLPCLTEKGREVAERLAAEETARG